MKRIFYFMYIICLCTIAACSDNDTFTTSTTARLSFSVDSVKMDTVFSTIGSRTYDFWVYNRSRDGLRLQSVRLRQGNQTGFRVNVDGTYLDNALGSVVNNLEVRKGDSIRVFVELTAAENLQAEPQKIEDELLFTLESGVQQQVTLLGYAWDATIYSDTLRVTNDMTIESRKPIVLMAGLSIDSTATLTVRNTTLYFHDRAGIDVYGTLITDSVTLRGDRLDHMFDYLPYDRVSGQWRGVHIHPSSTGNEMVDTEIRNAETAVACDSALFSEDVPRLYMQRCVIHNCAGHGLQAFNSHVRLLRCQISNTLGDCLAVYGGAAVVDHCTIAQFYPLSADRGAALRFANHYGGYSYPLHAMQMSGSIVTGYADDVVMGDRSEDDTLALFAYYFENSLLRTPEVDDTVSFRNIMWETPDDSIQGKQHFRLIDERNMIYDFHLDSLSTATGLGCYD